MVHKIMLVSPKKLGEYLRKGYKEVDIYELPDGKILHGVTKKKKRR